MLNFLFGFFVGVLSVPIVALVSMVVILYIDERMK